MENEIYLDFEDIERNKWLKLLLFSGKVVKKENDITIICRKKNINKIIKKLDKKLKETGIRNIVCSRTLLDNDEILNYLYNNEYTILNGNWLYKFLPYEILNKISYVRNVSISKLEVAILTNETSDVIIENIKLIGRNCKILNIVTEDCDNFLDLEKFFMKEYGILINVSSNKSKSLLHSDVIFNFNFDKNRLKKCNLNNNSILVQMNKEKFMRKNGVTICSCKLSLPQKYFKFFNEYKNFDEDCLYEGLLYSKISFENVRKILKRDNIGIKYFIGNNGKIDFNEIRKKHLTN